MSAPPKPQFDNCWHCNRKRWLSYRSWEERSGYITSAWLCFVCWRTKQRENKSRGVA